MSDITVEGDKVFYDLHHVANLLPGVAHTFKADFIATIQEIVEPEDISDAKDEGAEAGKTELLDAIREALKEIDFRDEGCEAKLIAALDDLEERI